MTKSFLYFLFIPAIFLCLFFSCSRNDRAQSQLPVSPLITPQISYFMPDQVTLTDGPFRDLQNHGENYLLWLHPDSLLHFFHVESGLTPKAGPYAGWESEDVWGVGPLRGGFMGYYLSGLAMMYRTTGNRELLEQLQYTLSELDGCRKSSGDGYLLGIQGGREMFRDVTEGKMKTDNPTVNGVWAPLYLINKMIHGFKAAYVYASEDIAVKLMVELADWFGTEVLDKLTDEQVQTLLVCEHGSINESYLDVYELTGEKRFLDWAGRLNDEEMWIPLSEDRDVLHGWHANTQIPKFTGFEKYYAYTGDERFAQASRNFWSIVARRHSWVIGGNSTGEHFFPIDEFKTRVLEQGGPETCNSVNMLRLIEAIFENTPHFRMAETYERILFNHILSAYDPQQGMCTYFTPMRPGHYKVYGSCDHSFWCCNQSGLETPARLGKFIYAKTDEELMVNLYIPSVVRWQEKGVTLSQESRLPESGTIRMSLRAEKGTDFAVQLRIPPWGLTGRITVNGETTDFSKEEPEYLLLRADWQEENEIRIDFDLQVYTEKLPGTDQYAALLYGPYVLAGRMGSEHVPDSFWAGMDNGANNIIPIPEEARLPWKAESLADQLVKQTDDPLVFGFDDARYRDVVIEPYYRIHFERYAVYWQLDQPES